MYLYFLFQKAESKLHQAVETFTSNIYNKRGFVCEHKDLDAAQQLPYYIKTLY
jgi:hypothetical protein